MDHSSIDINANFKAPIIFFPERFNTSVKNEVLIIDLGTILMESQMVEFNSEIDYKLVKDPVLLFDIFKFHLKDLQVAYYYHLPDYRKMSTDH